MEVEEASDKVHISVPTGWLHTHLYRFRLPEPRISFQVASLTTTCIIIEPPHDKTNEMTVRPAKNRISLGIQPV